MHEAISVSHAEFIRLAKEQRDRPMTAANVTSQSVIDVGYLQRVRELFPPDPDPVMRVEVYGSPEAWAHEKPKALDSDGSVITCGLKVAPYPGLGWIPVVFNLTDDDPCRYRMVRKSQEGANHA